MFSGDGGRAAVDIEDVTAVEDGLYPLCIMERGWSIWSCDAYVGYESEGRENGVWVMELGMRWRS